MTKKESELLKERFYNGKTQAELAKKWNVSQMYVSRLEKKVVEKFRELYINDNCK